MTILFLWVSVIWIPFILYFQLVNETKFKKNIVVGVTLPRQAQEDEQVQALLRRMKKTERIVLAALLISGIACAFLPVSLGVMMVIYLLWIDFTVVIPVLPYIRCNRALKKIKKERGWATGQTAASTVVDLSAVDLWQEKPRTLWHFLVPFAVSILPMGIAFARGDTVLGSLLLMGPVCVALFWALYRFAVRRRAELVDENATLTETLTRLRRNAWRRVWLWSAWFMALLNICLVFSFSHPLLSFAAAMALTAVFCAAAIGMEFRLRHLQERLTADSGGKFYVDEDDKWIWGMFYYNPSDTHLIANARVGINTTVNLARRSGRILTGACVLLLALMPLTGVWIMAEEKEPVTVTVTDNVLTARHGTSEYAVNIDDIASAECIDTLPALSKVAGTGLDSVCKGRYSAAGLGSVKACLDPRTGPWLFVRSEDGEQYLFGATGGTPQDVLTRAGCAETAP